MKIGKNVEIYPLRLLLSIGLVLGVATIASYTIDFTVTTPEEEQILNQQSEEMNYIKLQEYLREKEREKQKEEIDKKSN